MKNPAILQNASGFIADAGARAMTIAQSVFGFLTRSLAEGIVYPISTVAVSVEEESFSVVKVSRFLCRTRARHMSEHRLGSPAQSQPEALASTVSLTSEGMKLFGKEIVLVVPQDWILTRTAELPSSVRDNICDVVSFELDRLTPFAAKDAYYDFRIIGEDNDRVRLVLFAAKADHLDSYLRAFKEQGITVGRLTFNHALGAALDVALLGGKGINLLSRGRKARRRVPVGLSIGLLLTLVTLTAFYVRAPLGHETARVSEIDRQIEMRKEAVKKTEKLRQEAERLGNEIAIVDDFKEKRPMALAILKELTGVLPKSAWLTRARITDTAVELEGYAASASEILPKLEQSKHLRKVEFASPTIRDQRMNADRFVMKMEIEGFETEAETRRENAKK